MQDKWGNEFRERMNRFQKGCSVKPNEITILTKIRVKSGCLHHWKLNLS